jgi:hypothetical protein
MKTKKLKPRTETNFDALEVSDDDYNEKTITN